MILHDEIIRKYIQDEDIAMDSYRFYPLMPIHSKADPKRKEVVMELHSQCLPILSSHTFYHHDICRILEPDYDAVLQTIHVHLVVNAPKGYDLYQTLINQEQHIFIDLIQIADITPIVSRMMYIILHQLSIIGMSVCMAKRFGAMPKEYEKQLDYQCFTEGFSWLMAWNKDISAYPFHDSKYDVKKARAFGFLYEFLHEENPNKQQDILTFLKQADFWNIYPRVAGMFYLWDMYQENGIEGLHRIYNKGYDNFIKKIYSS